MNHDYILNNSQYHVFASLDQCSMTIRVIVALQNDLSKSAQRHRNMGLEQLHWDSYQQIVREMAEECEKELENG